MSHLAMSEEKFLKHQARVHGSVTPTGETVLTLPWPVSANRYWTSIADPKTVTEIYQALLFALRGNLAPAQALYAEHANRAPFVRAMVFPSTEAKAYRKLVGQLALEQGVRRPLAGPIEVTLQLYPHLPQDWAKRAKADPIWWDLSVQSLDLDNAQKVVWDSLKNIAFTDDKMIRKSACEIAVPDGEARVVVTIKPYVRENLQQALFESPPVYVPKRVHVEPGLPEQPF